MIPKKIHYCWFGGAPFSRRIRRCMASWSHYCPGYELVRWDASNSPLSSSLYVRQAYQAGQWAFVSDYVRLSALAEQGGIYLDTDMELTAPLGPYRKHAAFLGFEAPDRVATCIIGAVPEHPFIQELLRSYAGRAFLRRDGSFDTTTNVAHVTGLLLQKGLRPDGTRQTVAGVSLYPADYFSPKSLETGRILRSAHTAAIHHFQASWMTPRQRFHTKAAQWIGPAWTRRLKRGLGREDL